MQYQRPSQQAAPTPSVDERVVLQKDQPELWLHRGDVGVVCSTWFAPATVYEVEFERHESGDKTRTLLLPHQIQVESDASQG
jgi:hypothetical protein